MSTDTTPVTPEDQFGSAASVAAFEALKAQASLSPGEHGWWKVWGASVCDIQAGDLVMSPTSAHDGSMVVDLVEELFEAKAAPARQGLVVGGKRSTIGALVPVVVYRQGTRHVLAGSVR